MSDTLAEIRARVLDWSRTGGVRMPASIRELKWCAEEIGRLHGIVEARDESLDIAQTEIERLARLSGVWYDQTDRLKAENATLRAQLAEAVRILRELEWSSYTETGITAVCPTCDRWGSHWGSKATHTDDCALGAFVAKREKP